MKTIDVTYQINVSVRQTDSDKSIAGIIIQNKVRMLEDDVLSGFFDEASVVKNLRELFDVVEKEEGGEDTMFDGLCDRVVNQLKNVVS